MYVIESYCFLTNETYIERFDSEHEREIGLKNMFIREDIQVDSNQFKKILSSRFYAEGYDSIILKEEEN